MGNRLLILDLGLYGGAAPLLQALQAGEGVQSSVLDLKEAKALAESDWDAVVEQVQRAERCITL